jgi:hypothetical protein
MRNGLFIFFPIWLSITPFSQSAYTNKMEVFPGNKELATTSDRHEFYRFLLHLRAKYNEVPATVPMEAKCVVCNNTCLHSRIGGFLIWGDTDPSTYGDASNVCVECYRWWCDDHLTLMTNTSMGRICQDCRCNGLFSGDIIRRCNECNSECETVVCWSCDDQFCADCTSFTPPLECSYHDGLVAAIPKRQSRRVILLLILIGKKRRNGLPRDLWNLVLYDFIYQ